MLSENNSDKLSPAKIKMGRRIAGLIIKDKRLRNRSTGGLEMADRLTRKILRILQNRQSKLRNKQDRQLIRYAISHWRAVIGNHNIENDDKSGLACCRLLLSIVKKLAKVASRRANILSTLDRLNISPKQDIHLASRICKDYAVATETILQTLMILIRSYKNNGQANPLDPKHKEDKPWQ